MRRVDRLTMVGWGALLMPPLVMWHEIAGHAATCAALGGRVATIGAFYVECDGLVGGRSMAVACAGVVMNIALALVAFRLWRRARGDTARLVWWLVWVSEGFVAAGYFCFSGVTGIGDLATVPGGALADLPLPVVWRIAGLIGGIAAYVWLVRAGGRGLGEMLGTGLVTRSARRGVAHVYYATCGIASVLVGLLNPQGLVVTLSSAAAASFGGLAGFINIGFSARGDDRPTGFAARRSWPVIVGGGVVLAIFAALLGPSIHPL